MKTSALRGIFSRRNWSQRFNAVTAKLSRGVMVPIAILPIAGLFLGISAAVLNNLPEGTSPSWIAFWNYLKSCGSFIFENLPALFAISIAIAFTGDSGIAGFTSFVGWVMFNGLQSALIVPHYTPGSTSTLDITHYSALFWNYIPTGGVGSNLGIRSLQSSIFGGILIGGLAAYCYNRFHELKLPSFLGFFAGTRSVPIVMITLLLPITLLFVMVWPALALVLNYMGIGLGRLSGYGNLNSLLFGYVERSLIPFGVHHAYYAPLWYSQVGGEIVLTSPALLGVDTDAGYSVYKAVGTVSGGTVSPAGLATWRDILGALNPSANLESISSPDNWQGDNRYFQQLNAYMVGKQIYLQKIFGEGPQNLKYTLTYKTFSTSTFNRAAAVAIYDAAGGYTPVGRVEEMVKAGGLTSESFKPAFQAANIGAYQQGKFAFMIFGIPAAGAAMVVAAPKENRKQTLAIVGSAALTSFLTGITEPFEFTFLFVSPVLFWGVHATFCAISFWLTALLGANIGQTFSGGIIDLVIYGFIPDIALGAKANSYVPIIVGLFFIPLYFFTFLFMIKRFNIPTPGQGGELITKAQYQALNQQKQNQEFEPELVRAYYLVEAYGGAGNIKSVDSCITKLRVTVNDPKLIDTKKLAEQGSSGQVTSHDNYIVAIFGTASDTLKVRMQKIITQQVDVKGLKKFIRKISTAQTEPTETTETKPSTAKTTKSSTVTVLSPVSGKITLLEELEDESFRLLGKGVAIEPEGSVFTSPIKTGVLELAYPAGHAFIFDAEGLKILVHVGIETVRINTGKQEELRAFKPKLKTGEKFKTATEFLEVDWGFVEEFAKNEPVVKKTTPIFVLNEGLEGREVKILVGSGDRVKAGEPLFEVS